MTCKLHKDLRFQFFSLSVLRTWFNCLTELLNLRNLVYKFGVNLRKQFPILLIRIHYLRYLTSFLLRKVKRYLFCLETVANKVQSSLFSLSSTAKTLSHLNNLHGLFLLSSCFYQTFKSTHNFYTLYAVRLMSP